MFKRIMLILAFMAAFSAVGIGFTSKADARRGYRYWGRPYRAYYGAYYVPRPYYYGPYAPYRYRSYYYGPRYYRPYYYGYYPYGNYYYPGYYYGPGVSVSFGF
ncbi:MAG TPA: hypothetical protein VHE81_22290 [Lacipirellulaceae bacterium]|nr:hypothetical protein [Lacipirellulaceae bacterium]